MRVKVIKREGGMRDVLIERTRREENPTRLLVNVHRDEFAADVGKAVDEVAGTVPQAVFVQLPGIE